MSDLQPVNENNFSSEVEMADEPVVVDFWAEWCGPCKQLTPRLEALAEEYGDVKFVSVDVDENQSLAGSFGIRSIPTLVFFDEGEAVDELTGAVGKSTLRDAIDEAFDVQEEAA